MVDLELAVGYSETILELRVPDWLVHLLKASDVVVHHFTLILFVYQRVHVLCCIVRDADDVLIQG